MKITDSKRKALLLMADELKGIKKEVLQKIEDKLPEGDTGGIPSEVETFQGMSYKEVLEKALEAEKEAIFLGLYLIELAPHQDIKKLVEITNDENDHSIIYTRLLEKLNKGSE